MDILNRIIGALGGVSMLKFLIRRLLSAIPVLFTVIFLTFMLMRAMPAGPFDFNGTKTTPPVVKAAMEARFGLDKPLLLNLPNDGVAPDNGIITRNLYASAPTPLCDLLRQGMSLKEATPSEPVYTYDGWALVRLVEEYRESNIEYADPSTNNTPKPTRCMEKSTVLYSDLTRSQFFQYFNNVLRLDFGLSMGRNTRYDPVSELISQRLPVSAQLGLLSGLLGFAIGIPLGVIAALYRNSWIDQLTNLFIVFFASIPTLALAPVLIILFNVQWKILPEPSPLYWKSGNLLDWNYLGRAILPLTTLALGVAAGICRLTRASVLQVLRDDYVRTARAKGLRERAVIFVHALKNGLIPVVTVMGPALAGLLTGTLILERIFGIPGLGSSFIDSITNRDYNMLIGVTILYSFFLIIGNILVDVTYTWLDPRIRFD
ncbi:MAG: ABC transporter permease [Anaerolineae bacterium]|nr:ABC transporter permease [Anaerolineae bacterium]